MIDVFSSFDLGLVLILIITGLIVGTIAPMVGIGGGLLLVPLLILVYTLSPQDASTTSLFVMIFTTSSGTYTYFKQKRIDLRTGLLFASCVVPASFIGSWISKEIDPTVLIVVFGLLLVVISSRRVFNLINTSKNPKLASNYESKDPTKAEMKYSKTTLPQSEEYRHIVDSDGKEFFYTIKLRKMLLGALIGGFLGGLLGVGGGVIFVPVLLAGGLPPHLAVATSTFVIVFTAVSGTSARLLNGLLDQTILLHYALPLMIGTVTGARLSASKVKKISSEKVLILFYTIVFLSGIRMILKAYGLFP